MKTLKCAEVNSNYRTLLCDWGIEFFKLTHNNDSFFLWYLTDNDHTAEYTQPEYKMQIITSNPQFEIPLGAELVDLIMVNGTAFALIKLGR